MEGSKAIIPRQSRTSGRRSNLNKAREKLAGLDGEDSSPKSCKSLGIDDKSKLVILEAFWIVKQTRVKLFYQWTRNHKKGKPVNDLARN